MSNVEPLSGEYPSQFIGVDAITDANAGTCNWFTAPLKLATSSSLAGANNNGSILNSGTGAPTIGGNQGDIYFRYDTPSSSNQRIYVCTVAGAAGSATWVGIV